MQDGDLAIHDLRSHEMVQKICLAEGGPVEVPSAEFGVDDDHQIFACAEACAFQIDMRQVRLYSLLAWNTGMHLLRTSP